MKTAQRKPDATRGPRIQLVLREQAFQECSTLRELLQELLGKHYLVRAVRHYLGVDGTGKLSRNGTSASANSRGAST